MTGKTILPCQLRNTKLTQKKKKMSKNFSKTHRRFFCRVDDNPDFYTIDWEQVNYKNQITYAIVCYHEGKGSKRPHFHIYLETQPERFSFIKKFLKIPMHGVSNNIQPAKYTQDCLDYIMNPEKAIDGYQEFGTIITQGDRTDFWYAIEQIEKETSLNYVYRNHEIEDKLMRNLNWCEKIFNTKPMIQQPVKPIVLTQWESEIIDILDGPVHDRYIYWYYGQGGCGKTTFIKFILANYKNVQIFSGATKYVYDSYNTATQIAIFEYSKGVNIKDIASDAMEAIKNGYFQKQLYHGGTISFIPPHVIVFWNLPPEDDWFAKNRVIIKKIN